MPRIRLSRRDPSSTPLPYTASPLLLFCRDILLFLRYAWALPGILLPLQFGQTTPFDELYPSFRCLVSVLTQVVLTIAQTAFLVSIPLMIIFLLPAGWILFYIFAGLALNYTICMFVLNGFERVLVSQVPVPTQPGHERECWFFINGVANRQVKTARPGTVSFILTRLVNTGYKITSTNWLIPLAAISQPSITARK